VQNSECLPTLFRQYQHSLIAHQIARILVRWINSNFSRIGSAKGFSAMATSAGCSVNEGQIVRLRHPLFCVFMSNDLGAGGVKVRVVVGVAGLM
jgi:hypothetical protein